MSSENDKSNSSDISAESISERLAAIELTLSQKRESKSMLQPLRRVIKKIFTRDNIEFSFSLLAFIISVSVAVMILRQ